MTVKELKEKLKDIPDSYLIEIENLDSGGSSIANSIDIGKDYVIIGLNLKTK